MSRMTVTAKDARGKIWVRMLTSLHIKNIVLIESLSMQFTSGLSVLTGETGAGKSILLDSLGLVLGERAEAGLLRRGAAQASVVAEFELPPRHPVWESLARHDIGFSPHEPLILRRSLTEDGRSKAFLNDQTISVSFLKMLGELLVDIHGQFETYGLINPARHRELLDEFGHHEGILKSCDAAYQSWQDALAAIRDAEDIARQAAQNQDYYRDAVDELEKLSPQPGEEESLIEQKKKIQNEAALREFFNFADEALGGEQGADILISQVWRALDRQTDKFDETAHEDVRDILNDLDQAASLVQSASQKIHALGMGVDRDGLNLDDIEDRLYALRGAARKYRCASENLSALLDDFRAKLELVDHNAEKLSQLKAEMAARRKNYEDIALQLHEARTAQAALIDRKINAELGPLKLEKAMFRTSVTQMDQDHLWGAKGFDEVRFMVATNAHDANPDFGPLNKIASGGEMARFMLALKVVLAEQAPANSVFVFDEIDTGIGGATASAVGDRLAGLAERHQVMVVTHSPQVAARASHHWMVSKSTGQTRVTPLDHEARREEIARMLAGAEITTEARAAAAKLLKAG